MDSRIAQDAARRLLKSILRSRLITALVEEHPKWGHAIEVEECIQQQAQESWNQVRLSWASRPAELEVLIRQAYLEAIRDVRITYQGVVAEEWITQRVAKFALTFTPFCLMTEA